MENTCGVQKECGKKCKTNSLCSLSEKKNNLVILAALIFWFLPAGLFHTPNKTKNDLSINKSVYLKEYVTI